jgi:hypothetical protein
MREVEQLLTEQPKPIVVLAREVYAVEQPTRAQVEAIRRAAKRLVAQDRAHTDRQSLWWRTDEKWPNGQPKFSGTRSTLNVRVPLTEAEFEANRRMAEALLERIKAL